MSFVLDLWEKVMFGFFFYLAVIGVIMLWAWSFGLNYFDLVLILVTATFLRLYLNKETKIKVYLKNTAIVVLFVSAFWFLPRLFGWWVIWVLFGAFIIYRFIIGRKVLMRSVRFIETKLFGKPLDRKEFKKGEKPSIYAEEKE